MLGPPAQNEIQGKSKSIIRQYFYDFVQILENWKVIQGKSKSIILVRRNRGGHELRKCFLEVT
jgi:hypothetical protein